MGYRQEARGEEKRLSYAKISRGLSSILVVALLTGCAVFQGFTPPSRRWRDGETEKHDSAAPRARGEGSEREIERVRPGEASWSTNIGSLSLGEGASRVTYENVQANCGMFQVMALLGQVKDRVGSCLQPTPSPRITLQLAGGRPTTVTAAPNNAQGQCLVNAVRGGSFGSATCTVAFTVRR